MENVAHRWEWRTFGARLASAESIFADLAAIEEPAATEETYLLGPGDVNVKIRFDLLDIKKLIDVDENGLELWAPVSKSGFPMSAEEVSSVFDAWDLPVPEIERTVYDQDQFLRELIGLHPDLEIVAVHKHRIRYSIEDCMA